jgi:hypothetical protein
MLPERVERIMDPESSLLAVWPGGVTACLYDSSGTLLRRGPIGDGVSLATIQTRLRLLIESERSRRG